LFCALSLRSDQLEKVKKEEEELLPFLLVCIFLCCFIIFLLHTVVLRPSFPQQSIEKSEK